VAKHHKVHVVYASVQMHTPLCTYSEFWVSPTGGIRLRRTLGFELAGVNLMNTQKLVAIVLLIAGGLGLMYGGFSYTKETHQANVGSLHLSVDETQHVNVPIWAGIGALVAGGLLLAVGRKS
jgi:hypothetical protein